MRDVEAYSADVEACVKAIGETLYNKYRDTPDEAVVDKYCDKYNVAPDYIKSVGDWCYEHPIEDRVVQGSGALIFVTGNELLEGRSHVNMKLEGDIVTIGPNIKGTKRKVFKYAKTDLKCVTIGDIEVEGGVVVTVCDGDKIVFNVKGGFLIKKEVA